jgi:hypothetical protein
MMAPKNTGASTIAVASRKQEALITRDGDKIQVTLRTHFLAETKDLAWVIPIPKKPEHIEKADDHLFDSLQRKTIPNFHIYQRTAHGCGGTCGSNAARTGGGSLLVVEVGSAGIFDYTVLAAGGVEVLTQWLETNGYAVPPGRDNVLRHYVEAGWYWLAIRLRPEASKNATLAPHPIRYTYRDDTVVYHLVISSLSADAQNEILLYVLSAGQYGCKNWTSFMVEDKDLRVEDGSPSGTNYERLVQEMIQREGGHAFVTEFAYDLDTVGGRPLLEELTGEDPLKHSHERMTLFYLTRLRTVIPRQAMDRDVVLILMQVGRYDWISNTHMISVSSNANSSAIAMLVGALLVLCGYRYVRCGLYKVAAWVRRRISAGIVPCGPWKAGPA